MYYPYLRGKQYELILLRDNPTMFSDNPIYPIIEPVKTNFSGFTRAIGNLVDKKAKFIVVANPQCGDLVGEEDSILEVIEDTVPSSYNGLSIAYIVNHDSDIESIVESINNCERNNISIIHYDFIRGRDLAEVLSEIGKVKRHIFIEKYSSKLYQKHFKRDGVERILIRDGFKVRKNEQYPQREHYSDLHITYEDEGMDGFGDFLIVGDEYREGGGPAYAVAIHLTYLNEEKDMFVAHFVSEQKGSPKNPARKFAEALEKLVGAVEASDSLFLRSNAYEEYRRLNQIGHFPGLGYAKKLSMQHHIELMAYYLNSLST